MNLLNSGHIHTIASWSLFILCAGHTHLLLWSWFVLSEKRNDSGSKVSKSDSGDEGKVEDIADEMGTTPEATPRAWKWSLTGLFSLQTPCLLVQNSDLVYQA